MKKTNLVLFPVLAALLLAGCTGTRKPRKKKSSSEVPVSSSVTPTPTSGVTPTSGIAPTSQTPTPTSQTPTPVGDSTFDLTPGSHTTTLDFVTNGNAYKSAFPYVEKDTGLYTGDLGGLGINGVGCWVGSYSGQGYLMMKNKDDFAATHGVAFIANTVSLGNITSISFTPGSSASAKATYNVAILSSAVTAEGGSSAGTTFTGTGGTVTGSGAYFCITQTNASYNGQLGTLTISYTIS